ncbi:MAG TPA: beta-ketoacyl synthase N-terminal-like domain-containing protein [Pseudomonas sp.]|nr:beta-ketoacyl synthase N-terminal-like domain-containing protein [Pseudomonas sp.]
MTGVCIIGSGLVSAVGLDAPSTCAAIRCALDNFQESRFLDRGGEWQIAASVRLEQSWSGRLKLIKMASRAIAEALQSLPAAEPGQIPLLLGVAEHERPGRLPGLDLSLIPAIETELGVRFHSSSSVIARGRVSGAVGMLNASKMFKQGEHRHVLVAGVDSFLNATTLCTFEDRHRLLTSRNSNGFIPGEGAAVVLLEASNPKNEAQLSCIGLGFGMEKATIENADLPLRADGLTQALRAALSEASCGLEHMDYRLTDLSGEQYYFKEASLALSRTMRVRKEKLDLLHPADCIGECGASIGPTLLAVALAASRKGYGEGPNILCHLGNDAGERAVVLLSYQNIGAC